MHNSCLLFYVMSNFKNGNSIQNDWFQISVIPLIEMEQVGANARKNTQSIKLFSYQSIQVDTGSCKCSLHPCMWLHSDSGDSGNRQCSCHSLLLQNLITRKTKHTLIFSVSYKSKHGNTIKY